MWIIIVIPYAKAVQFKISYLITLETFRTRGLLQTSKGTCKIKHQSFWINIFLHFLSCGSWCLLENSLSHWQHSNLIRRLTTNRVWLIKTELATPNKPGSRTEIGISWYPPMNSNTVLCYAATHWQTLDRGILPYEFKHCTVLVLDVALISHRFWVLNIIITSAGK